MHEIVFTFFIAVCKEIGHDPDHDTGVRGVADHRMGLSRPGLPVSEDGRIIAIKNAVNKESKIGGGGLGTGNGMGRGSMHGMVELLCSMMED